MDQIEEMAVRFLHVASGLTVVVKRDANLARVQVCFDREMRVSWNDIHQLITDGRLVEIKREGETAV